MSERTGTAISQVEEAVRDRYSQGAVEVEPGLCCPAGHDPQSFAVYLPEVFE